MRIGYVFILMVMSLALTIGHHCNQSQTADVASNIVQWTIAPNQKGCNILNENSPNESSKDSNQLPTTTTLPEAMPENSTVKELSHDNTTLAIVERNKNIGVDPTATTVPTVPTAPTTPTVDSSSTDKPAEVTSSTVISTNSNETSTENSVVTTEASTTKAARVTRAKKHRGGRYRKRKYY